MVEVTLQEAEAMGLEGEVVVIAEKLTRSSNVGIVVPRTTQLPFAQSQGQVSLR